MMLTVKDLRCEYKDNPMGLDMVKPRISWKIQSELRNVMQTAYQIQVSAEDETFSSILWDTGKIESDESVNIEYGGASLKSKCRYHYRVRVWDSHGRASEWSPAASWETAFLSHDEWIGDWITADLGTDANLPQPSLMLRRSFTLDGKIRRARVYATSLGLYQLHLNGQRVGDCEFTPGWTSYHKRLQYQTYDVTEMVNQGENALGAVLGDGWYKGYLAWQERRNTYGNKNAALIQMHVLYEDGKEDVISTDSLWKASTGPILMSDIYNGEVYDARLEKDGWCSKSYDHSSWLPIVKLDHPKNILVAQENVPVQVIDELRPISLFKTPLGETVLDMGQNMVGWIEFALEGEAGREVTLLHAEVLDKDGNFYPDNLRSAKQTVKYTFKGKGIERYRPNFSFQGFRYVKLEGFPQDVACHQFKGLVLHSNMEPTGSFQCSDELVNQLQHNILWGQKGNFLDVPTDCPQRDERLGWTGDAQVFIRTACYNMNTAPFFYKWLRDLAADQNEEKGVPYVIPHVLDENNFSSAAWGDAATICPWTLYLCYGDKKILEQQYQSMKAWVEYMRRQGNDEYLWNSGFHFGDWLALDAKEGSYIGSTATDFIATAFYAYSTSLLIKAAKLLGNTEDEKNYTQLYSNIIEAFRKEFVTPSGRLAVPTQTAHVLALMFDLLEANDQKRAADTLAGYIKEKKCHLDTGFVGTPYLCYVLSKNGYNDLAYGLLLQKDYPSWLYPVLKGATTIWEHWDGIKEDGSFWSTDMNSFNHYAYGAIGDWMYRVMAGIDTDEEKPGYKHVHIKPMPGPGISFVKSTYESMYGQILSSWTETAGSMEVEIALPPNTTATAVLPFAVSLESLRESGKEIAKAEGVLECRQGSEGVALTLGSGKYRFTYTKGL